jgi:hypothetical protein
MDDAIVGRQGLSPFERALRITLAIYLFPVMVAVLAIGLVGMVAARFGKPAATVAVKGLHPNHESSKPLGLMKQTRLANRSTATSDRDPSNEIV